MGLISKYVEVGVSTINKKHYEELGYNIPKHFNKFGKYVIKQGTKITVKVSDLTPGSKANIKCECDNCKKILDLRYSTYIKRNHDGKTYCINCVHTVLNSGINNHNYKFKKTSEEREKDRSNPEYQMFVKKVMIRDNYTCQCCGSKLSNFLEVHHLYGYNKYTKLRFDDTNGITLCKNCHKNFHNKYGNGDNTKEQFLEWIGKTSLDLKKYNGTLPINRIIYNYEKKIIYKNGVKDAMEDLGITAFTSIYNCCSTNCINPNPTRHKHHTVKGCHLFWYDEYLKMSEDMIDSLVNYVSKHNKKIICLTTGEVFDKIKDAHGYYGANKNCIIACCKHKSGYTYSGKTPNGTKLKWMYYNDYLREVN